RGNFLLHEIEELIRIGKYREAAESIKQVENSSQVMLLKIHLYHELGDFNLQSAFSDKLISNGIHDIKILIKAYYWKAWSEFRKGNHNSAMEICELALGKLLENGSNNGNSLNVEKSHIFNALGSTYLEMGKTDKAYEYLKSALTLRESLDDNYYYLISLNNIGLYHISQGELQIALELFNKALNLYELSDNRYLPALSRVLSNMGEIYRLRREYEKSLEFHTRSFLIRKNLDNNYDIAMSRHYLGIIEFKINNLKVSKSHFIQSNKLWKQIGNDLWYSLSLLNFGRLLVKQKKNVNNVVKELNKLSRKNENPIILMRAKMLQALFLRQSSRMKHRAEAQELLLQIITLRLSDYELIHDALINYIEILFQELKMSEDDLILEEAVEKLNKLFDLTRENNLHGDFIDVLLLKSKLCEVDFDVGKATSYLDQAQILMFEKGLIGYEKYLEFARKALEKNKKKISNMIESEMTIATRLEMLDIPEFIKTISNGSQL
ncbi:MAG: tetratricopeptide repeat protein, partial [Candidatus Heimdallarchaeota archaeon]|nr:tetratricopeptide repeat protein [Candidatus Heimdallarchaeota archaeon]